VDVGEVWAERVTRKETLERLRRNIKINSTTGSGGTKVKIGRREKGKAKKALLKPFPVAP